MKKIKSEEALRDMGVDFELITLKRAVHSVHDVQNVCMCEASEVIKTLVFIGKNPVIVVIPGDKRADIVKIKMVVGEKNLRMARSEEVIAITGYAVGSVSPFGVDTNIRQIADDAILALSSLFLGSGENDVLIKMNKDDFGKSFRGTFASISS